MNNQKNTNVMNIGFIAVKVILTTIAALINPWLVVPVLITMELTTTKLANKIRPNLDEVREDNIPLPLNSGKKPKENVHGSQQQKNVSRKRNVKFSRTVPQLKSSRPKAKKGDQI